MTRTCVLHVGMHKTGSTSVQHSLFRARTLRGATYLHAGKPNSSPPLQTAFRDDPGQADYHRLLGSTPEAMAQEAAEVRAALRQRLAGPGERFVLSAEALPLLAPHELARLRDFLLQQVDRLEVVAYVREPHGFLESWLQERVKVGLLDRLDLPALYPAYRARFEPFDQVFGRPQVTLWPYDPARFPQGCVVRDFCARTGLQIDPAEIERVNESLPLDGLRLLYAWRRFGPPLEIGPRGRRLNRALVDLLRSQGGAAPRLSHALTAPLLAAQAEDLAWMADRLGEPMPARAPETAQALDSEAALLDPAPGARAWLAARIGLPAGALDTADGPALAHAMERLAQQLRAALPKAGRPGAARPQ